MKTIDIKFAKTDKNAKAPQRIKDEDVGYDLFALHDKTIPPMKSMLIDTGIIVEIPTDYWASIRDKSGLALNKRIHVLGGVIDPNYRGSIGVILINLSFNINYFLNPVVQMFKSNDEFRINSGDRVAQLVLEKRYSLNLIEVGVEELSQTNRGTTGYGASGTR
jgi:dUTP pyrophosphatase